MPAHAPLPPPHSSAARAEDALEEVVLERLRSFASDLQGVEPRDLYALIMPQLERPLVRVAMELAEGRQVHAAQMLGIHRNTLRKRLDALGLATDGTPKPT